MALRQQAFIHFNEQPFEQKYIDMIYELAPDVDKAQSSQNDPMNERQSDVSWIDANEKSNELFQYIFDIVHSANEQAKWMFEHSVIEPLQFTQYDGEKEQKYDWHVDHLIGELEETIRKISFSILLNDEYEGGEFEIEAGSPANPKRIHTINLKKGDVLLFPSYTWHRVKPVTKGIRHSLVGWVRGPQWR
jgi:PKHD-type hydroxylase